MSEQELHIQTHTGSDGIAHIDIPVGIPDYDIDVTVSYSTTEPVTLTQRIPGIDKGRFIVPDNFDDPLPADILAAFEGES